MNLEDALRIWEETGKHGSRRERIERGKKWLPYYDYLAGRQDISGYTLAEKPDAFVAQLMADGAVKPGDTVLDIGAGTVAYALEFARAGCLVTALDACGRSLEVLQARAEKCGLSGQISTVCRAWEEFTPDRQYEVAFSSMCPAICNLEELERMESITARTCCLVTVARGSFDRHRRAMMAGLGIVPSGGMVTEALHYMNVLYLSGRLFQMKTISRHSFFQVSAETVLEQYPIYFKIFGVEETVSLPYLEKYLEDNAKDGFLADESLMNLAMIYWPVEK